MMRCLLILTVLSACDPYPSFRGEFDAGPVDPINFPPDYLGVRGDRNRVASGTFTAIAAYAQGNAVQYYRFPFSPSAAGTSSKPADPLAITVDGQPQDATLPVPNAYVFYNRTRCYTLGDYTYDQRLDAVPKDEQNNIFSAIPAATYTPGSLATWTYAPVVKEVAINANDVQCQSIKSEATLKATFGDVQPSGRYFAWAMIDPGAAVYRVGESIDNATGVGPQTYGWYNKYLVAYIDGGEIPTVDDTTKDGKPTKRMATQRIFFPRTNVLRGPTGPTAGSGSPGAVGQGYDVLEAPRDDDTLYSPVCAAFTYDLPAITPVADLPRDAETILTSYGASVKAASTPYFYCLQVAQ